MTWRFVLPPRPFCREVLSQLSPWPLNVSANSVHYLLKSIISNRCLCERFSCYALKTRCIPGSSLFLSICIQIPCSQHLKPLCPFSVYSWYAATFLCTESVCFQNFLLSSLLLKEDWNGQILCLFSCVNRFETATHQKMFLFCSAFKQQLLHTDVNPFKMDCSAGLLPRLYRAIRLAYENLWCPVSETDCPRSFCPNGCFLSCNLLCVCVLF